MPAQLLEHHYHCESFGSWELLARFSGNRIKISYDGKEQAFFPRYSADRKSPYSFGRMVEMEIYEEDGVLTDSALDLICEYIRMPKDEWPAGAA